MKKMLLLLVMALLFVNAKAQNEPIISDANPIVGITDTLTDNIPYYIGVSSNPTLGGTTTGAGHYYNGETCTLTASANQGYEFANWTENGNPQTSNPIYSFTVTESRNLVANFTARTFTISAYADPFVGGTVTGAGNYGYEQTCTLTATANAGYTFVCWTEEGANVSNNPTYSFTVTADRNLVATFVAQTFVISATVAPTNAGSVSGAGTYYYNQTCTLTATAETGYDFLCWEEDGSPVSNSPTYSFTVTAARNLVATFTPKSYVISSTVSPTESGTVSGTGTYFYEQTCTLTATANTGYEFVCWTEDGYPVSNEASYSFSVTGNRNLVANFTLASYEISVTIDPTIAGEITGSGSYFYGQLCTLTATAYTGYTFAHWADEDNQVVSYDAVYSFTVTASRNLVAIFTAVSFEVTVSAEPSQGGVVDGGDTYYYGQLCTVTAEANNGYNFVNWTENGLQVASNSTYEFTVTDNRNLVANFTANSYVISVEVNPENSGTIEGVGGYEYGQTCNLTAIPYEGYIFDSWTENGAVISTDENLGFVVNGNRHLVANFEIIKLAVEIEFDSIMGTCYGSGSYNYGDTCTILAIPQEHYHFVSWTENDEIFSTQSEYSFIIDNSHSLVANFALNMYPVVVIIDPEDAGEVTGMGYYTYGDTVTLCAEAYENYNFMYWMMNDSIVSDSVCYTFVLEGPVQLTVTFEYDDAVNEALSSMIALYPNPASEAVMIEGEDINMLRVFNVYGQLVDMIEVKNQSVIRLDVEHYQTGTYILMFETDLGTAVKRFVKQ